MALNLYKHFVYGTLTKPQVDSNWTDIEQEVNGLSGRLPLNNYSATTNPTVNDDMTQGYSTGSLWYNRTTDTAFVLTNASSGAANWVERDSISAGDLGSAAFADILGTVSQSGGVPTGAAFETGSNANGEYVKFADGTMICTHEVTGIDITNPVSGMFSSDTFAWTYPAVFISRPKGLAGSIINLGDSVSVNIAGGGVAESNSVRALSTTSITGRIIVLMAIGRWF